MLNVVTEPDLRRELVDSIRERIAAGIYPTPMALEATTTAMLEEIHDAPGGVSWPTKPRHNSAGRGAAIGRIRL